MTCGACVVKVQAALTKISGVIGATVYLEEKNAVVKVEKGKVTRADLIAAVKGTGFSATANY